MSTVRARQTDAYGSYTRRRLRDTDNPVIEGYFQKEISVKDMAIRKINKTLCGLLGVFVAVAFAGYYSSMSTELTLNTLSRQISSLNDENAELQNKLDKLKSFNNVDSKMLQQNLLQKPEKVIEVSAVNSVVPAKKVSVSNNFNWAIGY